MKKNIKDYLHLYKDVLVQVRTKQDKGKSYLIGRVCEISSRSNHGDWVQVWFDNVQTVTYNTWNESSSNAHHFFFSEDEIKPILRPLSGLTKEEMKELYSLVFNRKFIDTGSIRFYDSLAKESKPGDISRWVLWSGVERLGIQLDGKIWADSDLQPWRFNQHEATRFLLSKHFDLFGLIEAGLAIDFTTIKKPTK